MENYVVWIDSKNAHVFALKTTGVEKTIVSKDTHDNHTRHKNDTHKDSHETHYYSDLAEKLKDAGQLLIMGPGIAKNHFQDHLTTHQANTLAKKIIGLENFEGFEHKTENQMLAQAHKFFKKYDVFNNPI